MFECNIISGDKQVYNRHTKMVSEHCKIVSHDKKCILYKHKDGI